MKRKIILFFAIMSFIPFTIYGVTSKSITEDSLICLQLNMTDGTQLTIHLSDMPVISFTHDSLVVKTSNLNGYFWHGDVRNYQFVYEDSTISNINSEEMQPVQFYINNGSIIISNIQEPIDFALYSIEGRVLHQKVLSIGNHYSIPTGNLAKGVYLLRINQKTYKIVLP